MPAKERLPPDAPDAGSGEEKKEDQDVSDRTLLETVKTLHPKRRHRFSHRNRRKKNAALSIPG